MLNVKGNNGRFHRSLFRVNYPGKNDSRVVTLCVIDHLTGVSEVFVTMSYIDPLTKYHKDLEYS